MRAAKALKPGRDLGGVQVGIVAAAGADDLEYVGVAAFGPALHEAARLTPQTRRQAVTRLARGRECHDTPGACGQPRVTCVVRVARCGHGTGRGSRPGTRGDARVPRAGTHRCLASAWPAGRSLGQPDMLGVCLQARLQGVRPADSLKPGWDPLIIQERMITAVAADDLEQAGAVAFAVIHDPGRLPPQGSRLAMSRLASQRERPLGVDAEPGPGCSPQPACGGDGTQTRRRSGIRPDIWPFGATDFAPRC